MDQKKALYITIVGLAVIVAGIGLWYWQSKKAAPGAPGGGGETALSEEAVSAGFGAQILEKSQNPLKDKLPETNPFQTETNPLKNIYQNPF